MTPPSLSMLSPISSLRHIVSFPRAKREGRRGGGPSSSSYQARFRFQIHKQKLSSSELRFAFLFAFRQTKQLLPPPPPPPSLNFVTHPLRSVWGSVKIFPSRLGDFPLQAENFCMTLSAPLGLSCSCNTERDIFSVSIWLFVRLDTLALVYIVGSEKRQKTPPRTSYTALCRCCRRLLFLR